MDAGLGRRRRSTRRSRCASAREFARAAIGDRDLAERWLDRADNGFIAHVTSPWRWQSHLLALWEEARRGADRARLGRPRPRRAARLRSTISSTASAPTRPAGAGAASTRSSSRTRSAPRTRCWRSSSTARLEVGGGQETVCQVGWDPNDPFAAIWAPAGGWSPTRRDPSGSRWQQFTGQSGHAGSPHYDDLQPRWLARRDAADGRRGPWQTLSCGSAQPVAP